MRLAVTAAVLAATASIAHAGPPGRTPPIDYATPAAPQVKSESTATVLAIASTLGGFALMSAGAERGNDHVIVGGMAMVLIGPSAGHVYAGENGHAIKMSLLRTGGALVLGMGLVASFTSEDVSGAPCPVDSATCTQVPTHSHDDDHRTAERMMWLGGGVLVAATLYDLWDAHNAARRTNEKAQRAWTVAPMLTNGGGGFSLGGAF